MCWFPTECCTTSKGGQKRAGEKANSAKRRRKRRPARFMERSGAWREKAGGGDITARKIGAGVREK